VTSATIHSSPPAAGTRPRLRVALLLSTRYFEDFYGAGLGLDRSGYLERYRNDWSWDWCQMLAREQVQTTIYVPTLERGELVGTADGYGVRFLELAALVTPWVRFPVLERTPVGRYFGQVANTFAMLAPLRAALDEDGIDVVCVQEYWTARFDVLARTLGRPVVAVDQGLPDRREIKWLKRGAFRASVGVVVQTEREADKVGHYGGDARRIPNAVDAEFFSPDPARTPTDGQSEILFVGRLHDAQKRVSDALKALWLLPEDWRLTVVGGGPDEAALRRLANELGVSERVSFEGFVGDSGRLRDLYRRADVVAMPSTYEGLPMVLLEAMSCGTPVVGSQIPAIAGVVSDGETGILFPVGAPDRLASALGDAVAERDRLGDAARRSILADYDQAVVGPRLAAFLATARDAHSGDLSNRSRR
jgi:glycosyltransferase involved in cell wall biosynthesis